MMELEELCVVCEGLLDEYHQASCQMCGGKFHQPWSTDVQLPKCGRIASHEDALALVLQELLPGHARPGGRLGGGPLLSSVWTHEEATMKAMYIEAQGGPAVLTYGDRPDPVIEPHEVMVRVHASALNRLDVYTRAGARGMRREFPPPLVLGGDSAGDVVEVGGQVQGLTVGDRVVINPKITCGQCAQCLAGEDDLCTKSQMLGSAMDGSYGEYVKVPAANAHPVDDNVSYEHAAAVPTVFLPMWNMMIRRGRLKPWETVLVLSASAGVGTAAICVAKDVIGARVIATTSTDEKAAKARELGADEVINYTQEDVAQRVREVTDGRGVDLVVDHVGAEHFEAAYGSLRPGGRYGNCGVTTGYRAELHMGMMFTKHLTVFGVFMGSKEDMGQIVEMLNRGKIKPAIHQVFSLEQAADAHRVMEERSFFGKLILRP